MYLSQNENAIELLMNNLEKIEWSYLSLNPNAIELLRNNKNKIDNILIRENPNYYEIFPEELEEDENIIRRLNERYQLLFNINNNKKEIYFESDICDDIELMEKNQHKINWDLLAKNPAIFSYDYEEIKKNFKNLGEDIIHNSLHPKRMLRLMEEYGEDTIYDCYFD